MKNIKKYMLFAGIAAVAASCTDLDVPIESQYTQYPDNEIALEAKLADCYYKFREVAGRRYKEAMTLSSDEMISFSFDGNWLDSYCYSHAYTHKFSPDDAAIDWYWVIEGGITNCNNVILELDGAMENSDEVLAPVRAARAFYHFILMDVYGDVPILDPKLLTEDEIVRSPRADVARWIENELIEIIPHLGEEVSAATYGKPTKWMALALQAKLYINWAVYTCNDIATFNAASATNEKLDACIQACDAITASGIFSVGKGYRKKFFPSNGPHITDFIYAMPFDPENGITGMDYSRYTTYKNAKGQDKCYYGFKLMNSAGGMFAFNPEFVDLFCLEGDERNEIIVGGKVYCMDGSADYVWTDDPCMDGDKQLEFTKNWTLIAQDDRFDVGNDFNAWNQGYKTVKFPPRYEDYASFGRSQSNDLPVFRYADVLLTKAEALVRKGKADQAVALINEVRDCASAPHFVGTPTLQDILDERGRELVNENWRRNDQIRYGTFENPVGDKFSFTDTRQPFRRVMPLPTGTLNANTNWKQNPGY